MPKVAVYDMEGKAIGEVELSDAVFAANINEALIHQAVRVQLANKRQGTQSALTRAEVSGGGRKPWRQKGTGRARQGSIRSPQWRHGGVVFAPKPRDYSLSLPRKMRRAALRGVLSAKVVEGEAIVLNKLELAQGKTKLMVKVLENLSATGKTLVVLDRKDENVLRASSNIPGLKTAYVSTINVYDILNCNKFVMTEAAAHQIEEVYAQ